MPIILFMYRVIITKLISNQSYNNLKIIKSEKNQLLMALASNKLLLLALVPKAVTILDEFHFYLIVLFSKLNVSISSNYHGSSAPPFVTHPTSFLNHWRIAYAHQTQTLCVWVLSAAWARWLAQHSSACC